MQVIKTKKKKKSRRDLLVAITEESKDSYF